MSEYLTIDHMTRKDIARLFARITVLPSGCWQWNGGRCAEGKYGRTHWQKKNASVHRIMYAWAVEPVPRHAPGKNGKLALELDHTCFNTLCCNPSHLRLIPKVANAYGPEHPARRTHCRQGHAYTPDNTAYYPSRRGEPSCRRCKICHRASYRLYYDRHVRKVPRTQEEE